MRSSRGLKVVRLPSQSILSPNLALNLILCFLFPLDLDEKLG